MIRFIWIVYNVSLKGDYPIVIASDASNVHVDGWDGEEGLKEGEEKKKNKKKKMDKESGVARGIDFHQVYILDYPLNIDRLLTNLRSPTWSTSTSLRISSRTSTEWEGEIVEDLLPLNILEKT